MDSCSLGGMNGWVIFLLFVITVVYLFKNNKDENQDKSAKDILDERYAKGEIEKDEYQDKLKDMNTA